MRRTGVWHPRLAGLIAGMGHGDLLVVADPGLPVPRGVEVIDLVVSRGAPPLMTVLRPVLAELVVDRATLAEELSDMKLLADAIDALDGVPVAYTSHDALKEMTGMATAVVRTGEDTPYANIVLRAGVPF